MTNLEIFVVSFVAIASYSITSAIIKAAVKGFTRDND